MEKNRLKRRFRFQLENSSTSNLLLLWHGGWRSWWFARLGRRIYYGPSIFGAGSTSSGGVSSFSTVYNLCVLLCISYRYASKRMYPPPFILLYLKTLCAGFQCNSNLCNDVLVVNVSRRILPFKTFSGSVW